MENNWHGHRSATVYDAPFLASPYAYFPTRPTHPTIRHRTVQHNAGKTNKMI